MVAVGGVLTDRQQWPMPDDDQPDHPFGGFTPEVIEKLRQAHEATPLHQVLGLRFIGSDADAVTVEMPVAPGAFNGSGNLHGGAIATLIDVASGSAAARAGTFRPGENTIVTADLHVRYLGRPKGTVARAQARVVRAGRQLIIVDCRVADELGNMIAVADFAAMLVPLRTPLPHSAGDARMPDL
jgi:uncharacterized protein (TIGR00369 family)